MDPFAILRQGVVFNKKKFGSDLHSFKDEKLCPTTPVVAKSLDFFKEFEAKQTTAEAEQKPKERKRKRHHKKKAEKKEEASESEGSSDDKDSEDENDGDRTPLDPIAQHGKVAIEGADVPPPVSSFAGLKALSILPQILANLETSGYDAPTSIQSHAIPIMMQSREVLGCAPTGSGKTMAYAIPILSQLHGPKAVGFRACVVSPTRELAQQIKREFDRLGEGLKLKIKILDKAKPQRRHAFLKQNSMKLDIIISTPLRLVQMIREGAIKLDHVQWLILDEADRLLDDGFDEQLDEIVAACTHSDRRIGLFSATMPERIERIARSVLHDPIRVIVGKRNAAAQLVKQKLVFVGREDGKLLAMRQLVQQGLKPPVLIFVQSKPRAIQLFHELVYDGINVDVIHADRSKLQRDNIVKSFRIGKIWVMIATDLMARGLDFKGVNMVINYDFPPSAIEYVHRVGRTGRAGRAGEAVTFFTQDDIGSLKRIAGVIRSSGCEVPDWMMKVPDKSRSSSKTQVVKRTAITTDLKEKGKLRRLEKEKQASAQDLQTDT